MAQEVNVSVLRKQIAAKLDTLEKAIKAYQDANDKHTADRQAANEKFAKEQKAWSVKATKLVIKQLTADNVKLNLVTNRYNGYQGVSIDVENADLSALGDKPVFTFKESEQWEKLNSLRHAIPRYYDQYGRRVDEEAIVFHFKKALDMLEALPQGTTTVQVKDFNFLTKF